MAAQTLTRRRHRRNHARRRGSAVLTAAAAATASWLLSGQLAGWQRRWLATPAEQQLQLPGDDAVRHPATQITRAITVHSPAEQVWPWLLQLGADRGGFYSYDWLEDLFGLQIHSADRIVEAWQQLQVGDLVYATRKRTGGWYVVELIPGQVLTLQVADLRRQRPLRREDPPGWEFSWTFAVRPDGHDRSRLLVRERVAFADWRMRTAMRPVGLVSFVMTRRMMLGIRDRAEHSVSAAD